MLFRARGMKVVRVLGLVAAVALFAAEPAFAQSRAQWNPPLLQEIDDPPADSSLRALSRAHHRTLFRPAIEALDDASFERFKKVYEAAGSDDERVYLLKALAVGHDVAKVEWLAQRIRGESRDWLLENLTLSQGDSGRSLIQQLSHSCIPAIVQVLWGLYDPIYSYMLHLSNSDVHAYDAHDPGELNPTLTHEQEHLLESYGTSPHPAGKASSRGADRGRGRWFDELLALPETRLRTALQFKEYNAVGWNDALAVIAAKLADGMPVPFTIGPKHAPRVHAVMAVNRRLANGEPEIKIYDPWEGVSVWRSERALKDGKIDIANSSFDTVGALQVPFDAPSLVRGTMLAMSRAIGSRTPTGSGRPPAPRGVGMTTLLEERVGDAHADARER